MRILALCVLLSTLSTGQTYVPLGPNLPATCNNGQIFYSTGIPVGWSRCVAGTWESSLNAARIVTMFNSGTCSGYLKSDGTCATPASGSIPSGLITLVISGSCPVGFTEVSALNGKMLRGTIAANGDVGTTGGNATITPTGSVTAPIFTGDSTTVPAETVNSLTAAAQTFTGDATAVPALAAGTLALAHTHAITQSAFTTTKFTTNASGTAAHTGGGVVTTPSGAASSTAVTGSTATGSLTPLGHNATSAVTGTLNSTTVTPLGHNAAPTFTGNAVDPSPSYVKVIFCAKT